MPANIVYKLFYRTTYTTIQEATASEIQQITNSCKILQNTEYSIRRPATHFLLRPASLSSAVQAPQLEEKT